MGALTSGGSTTYLTTTPDGEMLGKRAPNGSGGWNDYYYLHDERGSIVALTDASGTAVDTFSYDPYGNQLTATGSVGNSFGFLGGFSGSGVPTLIQLGERYYDPTIGRFTQQDPLGGGYGYTSGDPINFNDPSGLVEEPQFDEPAAGPDPGGQGPSGGFNPFKGLQSAAEIAAKFVRKGFEAFGKDPENGLGGYRNPRTGRSYHIDKLRHRRLHVDVHYRKGYRSTMKARLGREKRRFYT